ncbi:ABC transporter ATP-binding protein [Lacisediminihabitans changchengi]|nr:ABC transporter ATP-binding protein [Lacisediminihabitans changchengi]
MSSLIRMLGTYRWSLVVVALIFVVKDSSLWLLPVITSKVIDAVVAGGPVSTIAVLGLIGGLLLVQVYPLHVLFTRVYMGVVRNLAAGLRNALTARLQSLSIGYHGRTSASVIQSKVVRDVENIELMFSQIGNPLGSAIVVFTGAVVTTAITVPQFLPVFALAIPCGIAVWWILRRRSQLRNEVFRRQMEHFSRRVGEMATLMPITRAHGLEDVAIDRVALSAEGVRRDGLSLDMVNGHFGALSWVVMQLLALGCLIGAGVLSVLHWVPITVGQVVLLSTYFTTLTGTVLTVLSFMPVVSRGRESVKSLAEVLEEPDLEQNAGKREVDDVLGSFELHDVVVNYGDNSPNALDGVTLSVQPGETVAFVGSSGSGKSTLINMLLGFVRPTSGRVLLDGQDMQDLDLRTARRRVSVVPQESVLFEGSIRENVAYGLSHVGDDDIRDALREANAWELVTSLPDGWDTVVGERGARLSGGQRQRISIARAIIRDPRVLVLDEATSALDAQSEQAVQEALERLMRGRTTLVVAHRLSTVMHADRIVVLERGRIVEVGTHEQLVQAGGRYAKLWDLQFR